MEPLTFYGTCEAYDGYGRACALNMRSLLLNGAELYAKPLGVWIAQDSNAEVFALRDKPRPVTRLGIAQFWHPQEWRHAESPELLGFSMWESTVLAEWFVQALNANCVAVATPSAFCKEVFEENGIHRPVHVVPHCVDDSFQYGDLREGRPVTFGTLGTLSARKGTDILLRCFARAFDAGQDVRLEIKVRGPHDWPIEDPRIVVHRGEWSLAQVQSWYWGLSAYCSATHGEGFALTPIEAMASGCAVVCTNWSGPADYMDTDYSYPLAIDGLEPAIIHSQPSGEWAKPSEEHLIALLREIAANPDAAKEKGRRASRIIPQKYPLAEPGRKLLEILGAFEPPRLRRLLV